MLTLRRHAESGWHLLQTDDHGDAQGEALDHRKRYEPHVAAEAGERHADEQNAGHQSDN